MGFLKIVSKTSEAGKGKFWKAAEAQGEGESEPVWNMQMIFYGDIYYQKVT